MPTCLRHYVAKVLVDVAPDSGRKPKGNGSDDANQALQERQRKTTEGMKSDPVEDEL
jgi:hypothetical protein